MTVLKEIKKSISFPAEESPRKALCGELSVNKEPSPYTPSYKASSRVVVVCKHAGAKDPMEVAAGVATERVVGIE
jgi:hypothetical protein